MDYVPAVSGFFNYDGMDYVPAVSGFFNYDGHEFSFLWIPDNEVRNTALLYSFLWRQLTSTAKSRRTSNGTNSRDTSCVEAEFIYVVLFQHRMLASNVLGISTSDHPTVNQGIQIHS